MKLVSIKWCTKSFPQVSVEIQQWGGGGGGGGGDLPGAVFGGGTFRLHGDNPWRHRTHGHGNLITSERTQEGQHAFDNENKQQVFLS